MGAKAIKTKVANPPRKAKDKPSPAVAKTHVAAKPVPKPPVAAPTVISAPVIAEPDKPKQKPRRETAVAAAGEGRPGPSVKQLEDKLLVQKARAGNQSAYSDLIKRHKHGVERLIRPMVRSASSDEVEDLVQEALTKAMLHLNSYSEDYAFSTWLYRIATNHAIDYLRRRKLNAFSISAPPTSGNSRHEDEGKEYEISDSSWVPDDVLISDERTGLIEDAIELLPENYRRIIRLRHNEDMEYEEIARVLKLPMGTVKVHLHRARAALARMLDGKI